ncbi:hypothetical protein FRC06_005538 [Ceratobasidium sp. 370]|nr:hypothetical protein FRC06_005538 [Ceratobasidium sp. 370]
MVLILSSCPELRLLSLNNVVVDSYIPPDPIILEQLQQLELRCDYAEYLIPLLRLLHPKDQCLTIRIDVAEGFEFAAQFRDFFRRTPMLTTLHIRPEDKTTWFASLPASSNKLSALTLEGCDFSDPVLARFVSAEPENNHIMLWPMLRSLRLVRCILDLDTLSYMTINRSLEILELAGCEIQNPATKTYAPATLSMLEQFDTSVINILVRSEE